MKHAARMPHNGVRRSFLGSRARQRLTLAKEVYKTMAESCSEFFTELPNRIDKEKVKGINAVYQWDITGDGGGKWNVAMKDGDVSVSEGVAESPDITLTVSDENFLDIVNGKLNGQMAFLTGKLKIQGDMTLAMKLQSFFG